MYDDDDDTLGPCGCTDYHLADCPTRTGYADALSAAEWAAESWHADDYR